jgi:hypothetical protein
LLSWAHPLDNHAAEKSAPKVISGTLGHAKVTFAPEVYDHASVEDMQEPLAAVASRLLPTVTKNELVQ